MLNLSQGLHSLGNIQSVIVSIECVHNCISPFTTRMELAKKKKHNFHQK